MKIRLKKYQYWLSFFAGIVVALSAYIFNPFGLQPDAGKAVAVAFLMIIWWVTGIFGYPIKQSLIYFKLN